MKNVRTYGSKPFKAVVIHGGPGAAGDMKPAAEELSKQFGVIEPLQTKFKIEEQVEELYSQITEMINYPVTLIGHSWGAWLALIFAAIHPESVKQLILIGSGPFEEKYTADMTEIRISHLNDEDKLRYFELLEKSKGIMNKKLGNLLSKADSYDLIPGIEPKINFNTELHHSVWDEAKELRRSGKFLEYGSKIKCPVTAIHGDYDTHPAKGVTEPLTKVLKNFNFLLLEKCGHSPWKEKFARDNFFEIIIKIIEKL
jgi:pimeloyl-ACP methyl ester carboxylesterase